MVSGLVRLIMLVGLLVAAGCATSPPPDSGAVVMSEDDPLATSAARTLWQQALQARADNQLAAASRLLERALYMEPDSSWLYRELAELRLREGDPHSAEVLAQRALRLAPERPAYQAALWELIATARLRQQDTSGAERARREAQLLWRR